MGLKPMNCPAHIQLYKDARRSYRDLPIRYSEAGPRPPPRAERHAARAAARPPHHPGRRPHLLHRGADPGRGQPLPGLRLRDLRRFGFEPRLELSTRPEKRIGSDEMWDRAEAALEAALVQRGAAYELNPGDGAFYGPKIDLHMTDSIGRSWQLGTVQLDYFMPERFELTYTGADNAEHRPVMIHRALMGSFERFIGILIEHYAGEFPLWLAPRAGDRAPGRRPPQRVRGGGRRGAARRRAARAGRRPQRVRGPQDPRGRAAQGAVHARRRRPRGGGRTAALRRHQGGDLGTVALDEAVAQLAAEAAERRPRTV